VRVGPRGDLSFVGGDGGAISFAHAIQDRRADVSVGIGERFYRPLQPCLEDPPAFRDFAPGLGFDQRRKDRMGQRVRSDGDDTWIEAPQLVPAREIELMALRRARHEAGGRRADPRLGLRARVQGQRFHPVDDRLDLCVAAQLARQLLSGFGR